VESTTLEALSYSTPALPLPVPARFYPLMGNNHHSFAFPAVAAPHLPTLKAWIGELA